MSPSAALWCWVTMVCAALMSLTRWMTRLVLSSMKSWWVLSFSPGLCRDQTVWCSKYRHIECASSVRTCPFQLLKKYSFRCAVYILILWLVVKLNGYFWVTGAADTVYRKGWHHLFTECKNINSGCSQSSRVTVEQKSNHHGKHPAASHTTFQVCSLLVE